MINFFPLLITQLCAISAMQNNDAQKKGSVKKVNVPKRKDNVCIQDINGKLWTTEEWDGSVKPNAIAVIADEAKFLIALEQSKSKKALSNSRRTQFEKYMRSIESSKAAQSDYDGAGNTANILKAVSNAKYAAGYCDAFTFPDGKTKGYLPSFGQLYLAYQNKAAVNAALSKCGGTAMSTDDIYWSSTFGGVSIGRYRDCWGLEWCDGSVGSYYLNCRNYVRPFADF